MLATNFGGLIYETCLSFKIESKNKLHAIRKCWAK